jgi:ribosome-associated translation inhibitor RaiA
MTENHGVTEIDSSGNIRLTGLVAKNLKSLDESVFLNLIWVSEKLEREILKYKNKLRLADYYSCTAAHDNISG